MGEKKSKLSAREQLFCQNYAVTGSAREAAARSGYPVFPEKFGTKLLGDPKIQSEISRIYREQRLKARAMTGYERLAFGGIADAVRLLFDDSVTAETLETLDLFHVAEIKRPRGGGMEIKFFDRLKALDKLQQGEQSNDKGKSEFWEALEEGARSISRADSHEI